MKNTIATLAAVAGFIAGPVLAEPAALRFSEDWSNDLTIYGFLPTSTTGTATIAGASADLDLDLSDVLDLANFALSARYEAWRGDLGLVFDTNYYSLSGGTAVPIGGGGGTVEVDVEQYWLGFLAAYRVASGTSDAGLAYSFDLSAGARYNSLKQEVSLGGGPGPGGVLGGTETWWEPVIGARYIWQINNDWTGGLLVDAGGFGVNGSDLQWSATVGADYKIGQNGALKLGIRYYSIDFETTRSDGTFAYDIDQIGPFVGYTFRF